MLTQSLSSLQPIVDFFTGNPEGRALVAKAMADAADKKTADRLADASALVNLMASDLTDAVESEAKLKPLAAAQGKAQAALAEADRRINEVLIARNETAWRNSRRLDQLRTKLDADPQPEIVAFKATLAAEMRDLNKQHDSVATKGIDGRTYTRWSNHEAVSARQEAIQVLRGEPMTELIRQPIAGAELIKRLDTLWLKLPAVDRRPENWHEL